MITRFDQFLNESIRDQMTGISPEKILDELKNLNPQERSEYIIKYDISSNIYGDDKELIKYLDDSILSKIQTIRRIRNMETISKEEIEKEIDYSLGDDSLDDALFNIQNAIGQKWGDNAGMYFSGKDDNYWSQSSYVDRKVILNDYLDSEELEEDEEIEYLEYLDYEYDEEIEYLDESTQDEYYVLYVYNWSVGQNTHWVRLYTEYTDEMGLRGDRIFDEERSRAVDMVKDVKQYLTKPQLNVLKEVMRDHQDIIILPSGKIGR